MNPTAWLVPLALALIGVLGVVFGARIAATSNLRSRLVDMMREDSQEQREFQIRAVAAVNELGTASALLIIRRLSALHEAKTSAMMTLEASGTSSAVQIRPEHLSPAEDRRVAAATERWRSVLAEGHAFASDSTGHALRQFDARRSTLVTTVNEATGETDLIDAITGLESAANVCEELRSEDAVRIYRNLQIEKVSGSARIFHLAHVRRLGSFTKTLTALYEEQISVARARLAEPKDL
jgi:hypothetical protein